MNLRFDFREPVEQIARAHAGGATLDQLAAVCERVAAEPGRSRKVALLADYLEPMEDADLRRAVRFLCGQPLPAGVERRGSVGHAVLRAALLEVCGWDLEIVRLCFREVGDTGETIGLLLHGKTAGRTLTLGECEWWFGRIYGCAKAVDRVDLLRQVFVEPAPLPLKYLVKVMTGNLRIGLQEKLVEEAVARATRQSAEAVREANNLLGRLDEVARAARTGTLQEIRPRLFHPMEFMLAKPLDESSELGEADWMVEDKYDGIRAQAHIDREEVRFFTRGQEEATAAFPELATALRGRGEGTILDGEILAWKNGRAQSFNVLQQRLQRKRVPEELIRENPAVFMAYDLICRGGVMRTDHPLEERRRELEELLSAAPAVVRLSPQEALEDPARLEERYREARERGNEGLLLKQRGSVYEAGKRSGAWRKVKRPYGTLDVVITAAEQGHGRRATLLSDYTFAVRDGDRFLNVGKAYSGLTDDELRELTKRLRSLANGRHGKVILVEPQVVLEVAFDGIQKSARHKSGYALRFPRILRWRADKTADQCDHLKRLAALYQQSLGGLSDA